MLRMPDARIQTTRTDANGTSPDRGFALPGVVVFLLLTLLLVCSVMPRNERERLIEEGGIVENASTMLHFVCFAIAVRKGSLPFLRREPALFMAPLLLGLRELDFDKRFTSFGIFQTKLYLRPEVSLSEKAIAFMVAVGIAILLVGMVATHASSFMNELGRRSSLGALTALTMGLIALSFSAELLSRPSNRASFHFVIPARCVPYLPIVEEISELGIPSLMLLMYSRHLPGPPR